MWALRAWLCAVAGDAVCALPVCAALHGQSLLCSLGFFQSFFRSPELMIPPLRPRSWSLRASPLAQSENLGERSLHVMSLYSFQRNYRLATRYHAEAVGTSPTFFSLPRVARSSSLGVLRGEKARETQPHRKLRTREKGMASQHAGVSHLRTPFPNALPRTCPSALPTLLFVPLFCRPHQGVLAAVEAHQHRPAGAPARSRQRCRGRGPGTHLLPAPPR